MSGDGYRIADSGAFKPMPKTWSAALDAMEASDFVADYLGEGFRKVYLAIKRREADRFASEVTALDYDWYLRDA
jgi:glutamine synthetase